MDDTSTLIEFIFDSRLEPIRNDIMQRLGVTYRELFESAINEGLLDESKLLLKFVTPTSDDLGAAIESGKADLVGMLLDYVTPTYEHLENAIISGVQSVVLEKLGESNNLQCRPQSSDIISAKSCGVEEVKELIRYGAVPTKRCFDAAERLVNSEEIWKL